jgi:hypothetical protein
MQGFATISGDHLVLHEKTNKQTNKQNKKTALVIAILGAYQIVGLNVIHSITLSGDSDSIEINTYPI